MAVKSVIFVIDFMKKANLIFCAGLVLMLLSTACDKGQVTPVTNVPVNLQININNPQYINLNHTGGWAYVINSGLRGIILFRANETEINAFDRMPPYPSNNACTLYVDSSEVLAADTCSGSKFLLFDGSVSSGPATRGMIEYNTSFNGTILSVYN